MSNEQYPTPEERMQVVGGFTVKHRYLCYAIDKRQSSPSFRDDIPDWLKQNCDDGFDVIVDLATGKRYWNGAWADVDVMRPVPVYNRHPYGEEETVKGTGEDEGRG